MKASYISERHVLPLVMVGSYVCAIGLIHIGETLVSLWARSRKTEASSAAIACLGFVLSASFLTLCLTKTLQPLHANRVGNREAGRWLAQHTHSGDVVVDEHMWSRFYSGLFFRDEGVLTPDPEAKRYTVVTRWVAHGGAGSVADTRNETEKQAGQLVYQWPTKGPSDKARVVVYETLRDPPATRVEGTIDGQPVSRPR